MRRILLLSTALTAVGLLMVAGLLVVVLQVDAGAQSNSATVEATNYEYTPDRVTIAVGGTVTFRAPDPMLGSNDAHPTRCIPENDPSGETRGDCPWGRFDLDPGDEVTVTFPESGTFQYICTVHPIMDGVVVVGDGNPPSSEPTPSPTPSRSPSPSPSPTPSPSPSPTPSPTASPSPSATAAADLDPEPTSEPEATQTPVSDDEDRDDDEVASVVPDPTDEPADVTAIEPTEPGIAIEAGTELSDLGAFAAQVLAVLLLLATMGAHVAVRTILRD
jgi:plastocyanin